MFPYAELALKKTGTKKLAVARSSKFERIEPKMLDLMENHSILE